MQHGIDISPVGPQGDPRTMAELAALAEGAGWDAVFLEDYVFFPDGSPAYDPWLTLAAIAMSTSRIRIGLLVVPLPRRRPWRVAAEAMTLDQLSNGRMILGVGSGDPATADFSAVGESADSRTLASKLDESLDIITALWSGDPVTYRGAHFQVDNAQLPARPVQRPRIPIWVGGCRRMRGPRERALRWDGSCLYGIPPGDGWLDLTPADVRALKATARERGNDSFIVAVGGRQRRPEATAERDYLASIAAAGADWWHEYIPPGTPLDVTRKHIAAGPLRP